MRKIPFLLSIVASISLCSQAVARIGENEGECTARYGTPQTGSWETNENKRTPLLPTGYTKTYFYDEWKIRVHFLEFNGPAVKLTFAKRKGSVIMKEEELVAILKANTQPGCTWAALPYENPKSPNTGLAKAAEAFMAGAMHAKRLKCSNGNTAEIALQRTMLTIETPEAQAIEPKPTPKPVPQF